MSLEHLKFLERSDVKDADTCIPRGSSDEVSVRVPRTGKNRILVEITADQTKDMLSLRSFHIQITTKSRPDHGENVRRESLTRPRIPEGHLVIRGSRNDEPLGWMPINASNVLSMS